MNQARVILVVFIAAWLLTFANCALDAYLIIHGIAVLGVACAAINAISITQVTRSFCFLYPRARR